MKKKIMLFNTYIKAKNFILIFAILSIAFFIYCDNVKAESFDKFGILKNAKFNGISIYNNDDPYNNWAITENGESMALNTNIELYSDNEKDMKSLIGQNLLLTIDFCTMENFDGLTDSSNINGNANFIRSYQTQTIGPCKFKNTSYTGTLKRINLVFSFNKYTVNTESVVWLSNFNITFWGGGYAQGGGYNQVNSINIQYFSQELENQFETINQNQTIINQNNQTNQKLDDIKDANYEGETEQPNTDNYDNYENAEENLLENMEEMNLNNVNIAIDRNSSNFVWNTMTSLIQSNALIFSMIISILSIGIIKLMLGR